MINPEKSVKNNSKKYYSEKKINYESKQQKPIKFEVITINQERDKEKDKEKNQEIISTKLFSILKKTPEKNIIWIKRAKKCGINVYNSQNKIKTKEEIFRDFNIMLDYLLKLSNFKGKNKEKYKIFKVNTIEEIASIFDIKYENLNNKDLEKEIRNKIN